MLEKMEIYPDRAQYRSGETVRLLCSIGETEQPALHLFCLADRLALEPQWEWEDRWTAAYSGLPNGCYGVEAVWKEGRASTAFDVADSARMDIRYGFLSDFAPGDAGSGDIEFLARMHLNAVQFYDWMYRHDRLVADEEEYADPMGRPTSLTVLREKTAACRSKGSRPFAYGAVYAATPDFFRQHPDWAAYTRDGEPLLFGGWLYYMNTSPDCPWSGYIVEQYAACVRELGFQGIHMDTYGFPKFVWDAAGRPIRLEHTFPSLIERTAQAVREIDPDAGAIFNAVNNWPVEAVADAPQDAVYIEVWPPNDRYYDLYRLIREARRMGGKSVVLAAYMKPFQSADTLEAQRAAETALLLAYSVINASGGRQLVFGEEGAVLCDSYYARYAKLREEFLPIAGAYADFALRYAPLFGGDGALDISMTAAGGINDDVVFSAPGEIRFSSCGEPGCVWTLLWESDHRLSIQLLNLTNITDRWNEPKPEQPCPVEGIRVELLADHRIRGMYAASPERPAARPISYRVQNREKGQIVSAELPALDIWSAVWLEWED